MVFSSRRATDVNDTRSLQDGVPAEPETRSSFLRVLPQARQGFGQAGKSDKGMEMPRLPNGEGMSFSAQFNDWVRRNEELKREQAALNSQVGGAHYKGLKIQPAEYCHANGIPFIEGCAIKYLTRWRDKGGIEDLRKAKHFIEILIELETRDE